MRLEPLARRHAPALFAAGQADSIWTYLLIPRFASVAETEVWIDEALTAQGNGSEVPYTTVRVSDGVVVGSTRFLDIKRAHRTLEIGWTWLAPEAQRTPVNTEAKYLMLRRAFDEWGALRVQLKTDARNEKSRAAIQRIGAKFEGVLRKQLLRAHDGYQRDSAMFSVIAPEWPEAKAALEAKLAR